MRRSGAWLVRYALEQLPIKLTFGIPGVHNTELYDELNSSDKILPKLVTHECGGAFMADAVSRVSEQIGCMIIVPGAGVTHAASGIGEAYLDGIPLLVISGGIRSDSKFQYQLHDIDQHQLLSPITKQCFKIESHDSIVTTIFAAYQVAISGQPGPVFIELPVNLQMDKGELSHLPEFCEQNKDELLDEQSIQQAVGILDSAKRPGIFVGWGAVDAVAEVKIIAEHLAAPVATTLQGLSSFSAEHPLHVGFGFGPSAVPAARKAFEHCDCLLVIGAKFSEVGTGSFGLNVPKKLIHIDIDETVINKNYPAQVALIGDARKQLSALYEKLKFAVPARDNETLVNQIAKDKAAFRLEWHKHDKDNCVNPLRFFDELRLQLDNDAIIVVDDGNHTFLTAELMPVYQPRGFILPTDFNCMGYAIPAAIGAKMSAPDKQVVSIVGDGAFLMTGMELATAVRNKTATINFIFNDGELSQIAQAQTKTYNRATCTRLASIDFEAFAKSVGCEYLLVENNEQLASIITQAFVYAEQSKPVLVNVKIDYSKATCFTQGVVKTNVKRLPLDTKFRMIGRAVYRKVTGKKD